MLNLKQQAIQLASEISEIFFARFGYTPIIGGSLSLIINGYVPKRYKDQTVLTVGDIDLCLEDADYQLALKETVWSNSLEQSVPNTKCIKHFINTYRVEVYPLLKIDTDECQWYWLNSLKIANPALALHAKAEYVISELGGRAMNPEYQNRRCKRIRKHYDDIRFAKFDLEWQESSKTTFVKTTMWNIVDNYIEMSNNQMVMPILLEDIFSED